MSDFKKKKINLSLIDTELEVASLGIIGIIGLETIALLKGVDGTMFASAMAGVGAIIGWTFKGYRNKNIKK